MSQEPAIIVTQSDYVVTLEINNLPMNPLGIAQIEALAKLMAELDEDKSVRAIVIKGADGKNFSVGANLKEGHIAYEVRPKQFVAERVALFNSS